MTQTFADELPSSYRTYPSYKDETFLGAINDRFGWLFFFFIGLIITVGVVEAFEKVLESRVELTYFVPLLIGHGGNTGAQASATVIRALALGQVSPKDTVRVVVKETLAGLVMGAAFGAFIYGASFFWSTPEAGLTVAIALPVISGWANFLGAAFPCLAAYFSLNPATTSAPLMTTVVDSTGLIIYFYIAKWLLRL